jgi:hypothetical protein
LFDGKATAPCHSFQWECLRSKDFRRRACNIGNGFEHEIVAAELGIALV